MELGRIFYIDYAEGKDQRNLSINHYTTRHDHNINPKEYAEMQEPTSLFNMGVVFPSLTMAANSSPAVVVGSSLAEEDDSSSSSSHSSWEGGRRSNPMQTTCRSREQEEFGSVRSANIPLPSSHIHRTESEIQLDMDEVAAEQREMRMFYRMVNGLRERQRLLSQQQQQQQQQRRSNPTSYPEKYHEPHRSPATYSSYPVVVSQDLLPLDPQDHDDGGHYHAPPLHDLLDFAAEVSDDWSITGYETTEIPTPSQQDPPYYEPVEDQGIFDLDL